MRQGLRRLVQTAFIVATAPALLLLPAAPAAQAVPAAKAVPAARAAPARSAAAAAAVSGLFVALGDSYAAGSLVPVSPAGAPAGCLRSSHDYGADAAASAGLRYVDATCTGASTRDMTRSEAVLAGVNPPQFAALAADDSVVTLTIGGDDVGFAGILKTCAALSLTDLFGRPCQHHYTSGGADRLAAAVRATAPKVAATLRGIHARAPHARVLLVGYPDILPATGDGCWPEVPFAFGDLPYLRGVEIGLNRMLAGVAGAGGATFVDTYTATIGHDACQSPAVKDVEGLIPASLAYPFHPNQRGERVMAGRVLAALRR
ncbi:MAG: SGNH/GDSL hydrolase family protein [Actinobacteria bacterium]|nr:SGNH/GDSL hydrolase family protein [Actinomycetota bacterium]